MRLGASDHAASVGDCWRASLAATGVLIRKRNAFSNRRPCLHVDGAAGHRPSCTALALGSGVHVPGSRAEIDGTAAGLPAEAGRKQYVCAARCAGLPVDNRRRRRRAAPWRGPDLPANLSKGHPTVCGSMAYDGTVKYCTEASYRSLRSVAYAWTRSYLSTVGLVCPVRPWSVCPPRAQSAPFDGGTLRDARTRRQRNNAQHWL